MSRRIVDAVAVPVFLAGGLDPDNVAEAIEQVRPFGLDLCSGLRPDGALDRDRLAPIRGRRQRGGECTATVVRVVDPCSSPRTSSSPTAIVRCSSTCRWRSTPATASASSAPTASASRRCCASSPGSTSPTRGAVERSPRTLTVGLLRQEIDPVDGRERARVPGPPDGDHRRPPTALDRATEALGADDDSITAHAEALDRFLALGGDDFEARVGSVLAELGLPSDRLELAVDRPVGRSGGPRRTGRHPAQPAGRPPARRAHQRPRPRRPRSARALRRQQPVGHRHRVARPRLPRPLRAPHDRDHRGAPPQRRVRRRLVRLRRGPFARPAPAAGRPPAVRRRARPAHRADAQPAPVERGRCARPPQGRHRQRQVRQELQGRALREPGGQGAGHREAAGPARRPSTSRGRAGSCT